MWKRLKPIRSNQPEKAPSLSYLLLPALVSGVIALIGSALTVALNYVIIERAKHDIELTKIDIEKGRRDLDEARVGIERARVGLDTARLDLDKSRLATETVRVELENARLELEKIRAAAERSAEQIRLANEIARTKADETRLTVDVSRLLGDLRPVVKVECNANWDRVDRLSVTCNFLNLGTHSVRVAAPTIVLLDPDTRSPLPVEAFEPRFLDGNHILARSTGNNTYELGVSAEWTKTRRSPIVVRLEFSTQTDPQVVTIAQRLASAHLTRDEIAELAKQGYTFNVWQVKYVGP